MCSEHYIKLKFENIVVRPGQVAIIIQIKCVTAYIQSFPGLGLWMKLDSCIVGSNRYKTSKSDCIEEQLKEKILHSAARRVVVISSFKN